MGMGVTIHGFIEAPAVIGADGLRMYRHNRLGIRALREKDANVWITRSMFAVPRYRPGKGWVAPQYDQAPIHFAANYKEMLFLPASWIREFEQILATLFWNNAVVYNNFTGIRYEWEPDGASLHDPLNRTGFILKCSVGRGEAVSYKEAIDGDYTGLKLQRYD
jgi:hypothetical protein